jgi:branched-chain amino acid transport system permease protein
VASSALVETYRRDLRFAEPSSWAGLALLLGALAALPWWADPAWVVRASLIWLYAIGVMGQNLLIGYTGLVSFGQAGFLAIGAYAFGHLRLRGVPFLPALAAGGLAAAAAGVLVGFPSLRLRGPYLAIATLGFSVAVYQLLANSEGLSGGRTGLAVPRLAALPGLSREETLYLGALGLLVLFAALTYNLVGSWVGRALVAVRDGEIAAEAMGVNLTRYKVLAFALSSLYTGVQGGLLAQFLGHLEPQTFGLGESITLLVAVIVGGLASVEGSVLGAAFVVLVPALVAEARWLVPVLFGGCILVTLVAEPLGLAGRWHRARLYFRAWPFR